MIRIAINGVGRTGRLMLREHKLDQYENLQVVAVNELAALDDLVYLTKYDSVHGKPPYTVSKGDGGESIMLADQEVKVLSEPDPAKLPWGELGIDIVIECTGKFTARTDAQKHIDAGAKYVIIGAPSKDADFVVVCGVNDQNLDPEKHRIISNASCTTNSLAPPLKVLLDTFGLEEVLVTTVHAYTVSQALCDKPAKKMHRGRAAALSLIPTTTGADSATQQVIPELKGRIKALCIRVPVPDGAITDISARVSKPVTAESVNKAFEDAANGSMQGVLGYTEEELVSIDIIGEPESAIVHGLSTAVVNDHFVKLHVWYDNEYGYARRVLDVAQKLCG